MKRFVKQSHPIIFLNGIQIGICLELIKVLQKYAQTHILKKKVTSCKIFG